MNILKQNWLFTRAQLIAATVVILLAGFVQPVLAQSATNAEPPRRSASELQALVAPIALYPDDLVGVLLPAASYPLQLVQAGRVISTNGEPSNDWDESVVAIMNYPEVVEFLNEDLDWTYSLGLAFVNQEAAVLAAIQSFRGEAMAAGNLRSDEYQDVSVANGVIAIRPQDAKEIYVPYYEPRQVIVQQVAPVYYYHPIARPVYYYPYPANWAFNAGLFYGVGSYFNIGWNLGGLNVFYANQIGHPFFGRRLAQQHFFFRPRVRPVRVAGVRHNYRPGRHVGVRHPVRVRNQRRANAAYRSGVRDGRQVQRRRTAIVNNRPGVNRRNANRPRTNPPRANAPRRAAPRVNGPRNAAPRTNNAPRWRQNNAGTVNNRQARSREGAVNRSPQNRSPRNATRPGRVGQESAARRQPAARAPRAQPRVSAQPQRRAAPPRVSAQPQRRAAPPGASAARAPRPNRQINRANARPGRSGIGRANRNGNRGGGSGNRGGRGGVR